MFSSFYGRKHELLTEYRERHTISGRRSGSIDQRGYQEGETRTLTLPGPAE